LSFVCLFVWLIDWLTDSLFVACFIDTSTAHFTKAAVHQTIWQWIVVNSEWRTVNELEGSVRSLIWDDIEKRFVVGLTSTLRKLINILCDWAQTSNMSLFPSPIPNKKKNC
jgi:hypothetical protein